MLNNINWSKVIPWALVVILGLILFFNLKGCGHSGAIDGPETDSVSYYKNKLGETIGYLKASQDELAQAPKKYRDSIAALFNTVDKLQLEVVDLKLHGKTTIYVDTGKDKMVITYVDSGKAGQQVASASQYFSNPYYQVMTYLDLRDQALSNVQVQTFDSLLLVWKLQKEGGLFNRKTYLELDVKNTNPYNTISELKAYRVPPVPPKHWGIGIQVGWGYGFNATGPQWGYPIIGVGLQYNVIRF